MENKTLALAEQLAKRGWSITILIINNDRQAYQPSPIIQVIDLNSPKIFLALPKYIKILKQNKPKQILSISGPLNIFTIIAKILTGIPRTLFISERNHLSAASKNWVKRADTLRPFLARWLFKRADKVLCVSEAVRQDIIAVSGIPPERTAILPNLFDVAEIERLSQMSDGYHAHIPENHHVIVSVGRLSCQKDHATLIQAFADLRANLPATLIIAGSGQLEAELRSLAADTPYQADIQFVGFLNNPFPLIARSDVFVLPSLYEGLPGVLIEALALGKTCVASDSPGGNREVLRDGEFGYLCLPSNKASLAESILRAIHTPFPPNACRSRAEDFSIERNIHTVMAVLSKVEVE